MKPLTSRGVRWLAEGWRNWLYLLLGGALLVPVTTVLTAMLWPVENLQTLALLWLACVMAAGLTALIPQIRTIEGTAARDLIGLRTADRAATPGLYGLTVAHLVLGATHSATTLFLVVPTLWFALTGRPSPWPGVGMRPAAVLAVLLWTVSILVLGLLFRAAGRRMLRQDPARRLAELGRRDTLARDLHDSLGHALAVISVQTAALEARIGSATDGAVRDNLTALASASRGAQEELDQALGLLRDDDDGGAPGLDSAPRLVAGAATGGAADGREADRPVTLDSALTPREVAALDGRLSRTAYRILQEALANALRHATGPVAVRIRRNGQLLVLEIRSGPGLRERQDRTVEADGPRSAADPRRSGGSGLAGMQRRAALAGGTLQIDEDPAGWTVRAELPL